MKQKENIKNRIINDGKNMIKRASSEGKIKKRKRKEEEEESDISVFNLSSHCLSQLSQ